MTTNHKPHSLGKWAVVDEESMSTEPNAALYSIGATMMDDLEIVDRFYVNIDPQTCLDVGLDQSDSTMQWWAKQGKAAQDVLLVDRVPLVTALQMWSEWIGKYTGRDSKGKPVPPRLMGNGPCADNMWLNSAYKAVNAADPSLRLKNPVPYWNDICHRTLNWIGGAWVGVTKEDVTFKGVKHHAGDDAEHEAHHALLVLNQLKQALLLRSAKPATGAKAETTKQEFVLNNVTQAVRDGRVSGLVELAEQLAVVYEVASDDKVSGEYVTATFVEPEADDTPQQVESLVSNTETYGEAWDAYESETTADVTASEPVPTPPPADDAPRSHDDWGLPFSEEWNTSTRSVVAGGQFKRKPGTNEEEYAAYLQQSVADVQAAGTFTGPDNWASVARVSKYLTDAPSGNTPQPEAQTVTDATPPAPVTDATPPAPVTDATPPAPVTDATPPAPSAPVSGASAASEVPCSRQMIKMLMEVGKAFGVTDPRAKCVLEALGVVNTLQITADDKKIWYMNASRAVIDNIDDIKADTSGEMLKTVLDNV